MPTGDLIFIIYLGIGFIFGLLVFIGGMKTEFKAEAMLIAIGMSVGWGFIIPIGFIMAFCDEYSERKWIRNRRK